MIWADLTLYSYYKKYQKNEYSLDLVTLFQSISVHYKDRYSQSVVNNAKI